MQLDSSNHCLFNAQCYPHAVTKTNICTFNDNFRMDNMFSEFQVSTRIFHTFTGVGLKVTQRVLKPFDQM